jgi:hypothetical protein
MGIGATISRKKALDAAGQAVDKANELTAKHNEIIEEVAKIRNGLAGLQEHTGKRLDAQLAMIGACEGRITSERTDVDKDIKVLDELCARNIKDLEDRCAEIVKEEIEARQLNTLRLTRAQERFEQMGFWARLNWLVFGEAPPHSH